MLCNLIKSHGDDVVHNMYVGDQLETWTVLKPSDGFKTGQTDLAQARRFSSGPDGKPYGFQASCHGKPLDCLDMLETANGKRHFALRRAIRARYI